MKPVATYRLQFRDGMTFDRAIEILPYLKRLGISHLYASPIFTATTGSTHGYDVTDCNEIDPAIGGREGFERLVVALKAHGLGLILDIVPNHMAASLENSWWRSVVEWGDRSPFARHFDIDWSQPLTLPILGDSFAAILEAGELRLDIDWNNGCLALAYYENRFPLDPSTYRFVFGSRASSDGTTELLEAAESADPYRSEGLRDSMARLDRSEVRQHLEEISQDHALMRAVHDRQPWRLTDWREARRHLSYRRFFEVTGLVGLRVEDEKVYRDVHELVLGLVRSGHVDGLRVDHIDGLADPAAYLRRLRADVGEDTYLVVEKILEGEEELPADWPIDGTTGYEFITSVAGLLTDEGQAGELQDAYARCRGSAADLEDERRAAKETMVRVNFEGEVSTLVALLGQAIGSGNELRLSTDQIRDAICSVVVAFPVYRTYATADGISGPDSRILDEAVATARRLNPEVPEQLFDAILTAMGGEASTHPRRAACEFRRRFQQLTGPVMAKAIEDTLFYRYNRLIGVNEVGGDPDDISHSPHKFHARMAARAAGRPLGLLTTSTHDTKRGEDARARLYAISEMPQEWGEFVTSWRRRNANFVAFLPEGPAPDPDTEWLIYQALAGVWPNGLEPDDEAGLAELRDRFLAYLEKAGREAKCRTSWTDIDESYERSVQAYGASILSADNRLFLEDFVARIRPIVAAGQVNSLSQTLIKLTAPGIPDTYQGAEAEDLSLVDPDNRRSIDFSRLARNLAKGASLGSPSEIKDVASVKQWMIARANALRADVPDLFTEGGYRALDVLGSDSRHVVAYARVIEGSIAVTVVPRLPLTLLRTRGSVREALEQGHASIRLPSTSGAQRYTDIFTGRVFSSDGDVHVHDLLNPLPFSLLCNLPNNQARPISQV